MFCSSCGLELDGETVFCPKCGTKVEISEQSVDGNMHQFIDQEQVRSSLNHTNIDDISNFATFWQRAGAYIMDIIIQIVIAVLILIPIIVVAGEDIVDNEGFVNILSVVVGWIYFASLESSAKQATFGKTMMGLKVVDLNGNRISFLRATGRHFARILSVLTLLIGYLMVLFTKKRQGLHDMIAGTYVLTK